jgi:hypothetical protein
MFWWSWLLLAWATLELPLGILVGKSIKSVGEGAEIAQTPEQKRF